VHHFRNFKKKITPIWEIYQKLKKKTDRNLEKSDEELKKREKDIKVMVSQLMQQKGEKPMSKNWGGSQRRKNIIKNLR